MASATVPDVPEVQSSQLPRALDWRDGVRAGQGVRCWCEERWLKGCVAAVRPGGWVLVDAEDGAPSCGGHPPPPRRLAFRLDSPDLQPAIPDRGMSLAQLKRFAAECRREVREQQVLDTRAFLDKERCTPNPNHNKVLDFDSAPTWLVVELFVKPATQRRRCPFVDVMAARWPDLGGPRRTTHFLSHSWQQCFVHDLEAVEFLGESSNVWMCCFAMTQDSSRLELLQDNEVFAEALVAEETVAQVLVLDERVTALTRLWVLFEVLRSHEHHKPMMISPPELLARSPLICSGIQLELADAAKSEDRDYILSEFDKVGLRSVNSTVRLAVQHALQRSLSEAELKYGPRSQQVAIASKNMGILLEKLYRLEESESAFRHSLDIQVELLGPHADEVAKTRNLLGCVLRSLGRLQEAEEEIQQALILSRDIGGQECAAAAQSLSDLGIVDAMASRFGSAEEKHRAALAIRLKLFGEDNADVAFSCTNLARVLLSSRSDEALALRRRALGIQRVLFGARSLVVALQLMDLGDALWLSGDLAEAEGSFFLALGICQEQLPQDHVHTARAYGSLGNVSLDLGKLTEAEEFYTRALSMRLRFYGPNHPDVARACGNLGRVYQLQAKYKEAKAVQRKALSARIAAYGLWHHEVARSIHFVGQALKSEGKADLALEEFQRALKIRAMVFRGPFQELITSHRDIGDVMHEQGQYESAVRSYQRALAVAKKCKPSDVPELQGLVAHARTASQLSMASIDSPSRSTPLCQISHAGPVTLVEQGADSRIASKTTEGSATVGRNVAPKEMAWNTISCVSFFMLLFPAPKVIGKAHMHSSS